MTFKLCAFKQAMCIASLYLAYSLFQNNDITFFVYKYLKLRLHFKSKLCYKLCRIQIIILKHIMWHKRLLLNYTYKYKQTNKQRHIDMNRTNEMTFTYTHNAFSLQLILEPNLKVQLYTRLPKLSDISHVFVQQDSSFEDDEEK